jgi:cbb3-type cytochrome oxidase subunit 3
VLKEHVKFIGEVVGRKQVSTQSSLNAVVEIKLETVFAAQNKDGTRIITATFLQSKERLSSNDFLNFITAPDSVNFYSPFYLLAMTIIFLGILLLIYRYRCRNSKCDFQSRNDSLNYDEEKSNNLQNEETFRRFANPLKENIIVCNPDVSSVTVVDLPTKVNVVRPISHTSNIEAIEMVNDTGLDGCSKGKGISSKVLLSKTQNSAFQKSATLNADSMTVASGAASKEYNCMKSLNVNVITSVMQRNNASPTTQPRSNNNCDNAASNVFATVLV